MTDTARILVIDDETSNLKLMSRLLESAGYRHISTLSDPRQAAHRYLEEQPDTILLDLNMPGMDGFEVMEQLQQTASAPLAPILVLTAQHSLEYRTRALQSGARDYVTKPFERVELLARVKNLVDIHRYHRSLHDRNALLENRIRERTRELYTTRLQIVRRLGRAAEFRDNETGMHIVRMSKISALLGRAMGMSEHECDLLLNAAPMHDIGKIGIPDAILLKPGKLDPEEWRIMQTHTTIGAEILSGDNSALLRMAHAIALSHHEKWDGSGYPRGLKGEAIPLPGRICALADVFDALTSERPYKRAWPVEEALAFIRDNSGRHFDPTLVEKFMAHLDEIQAIRQRYADIPEEVDHAGCR